MSSTPTDNLSRDGIQQLLATVGSTPTEDTSQIAATEYDWRQSHYFSSSQLSKLDDFTKKVAAAVAEKFTHLCHSDFNVTISSTTQHFAGELLDQILSSEQRDYYLAFGPDQEHLCGLISIPPQTAVTWATELLGDSESERESSKVLSQLEESLLLDIGSAIVEVLSSSLYGYYDFQPDKTIIQGQLPIELQGAEEICKIALGVKKTDSENGSEAYILIPCSMLAPVVGKAAQADGEFSAEDISKAMLSHVHEIPVSVIAQLASTVLTFEQIINLRPGDILLLDKRTDESVELIMDGRIFFHGRPAKSAGQYAVVITESLCHTENANPVTET